MFEIALLLAVVASNRLLVVEVDHEGAEVVFAKLSSESLRKQKELYSARRRKIGRDDLHVMFHERRDEEEIGLEPRHVLTFTRVRKFHVHGWDNKVEEFTSGHEMYKKAVIEFSIPEHSKKVLISDPYHERSYHLDLPSTNEVAQWRTQHTRTAAILQTFEPVVSSLTSATPPVERPLPQSGPVESQQNFVFLSGGYLASQQTKFRQDLDHVVHILQTSCDGCSDAANLKPSVPFRRYFTSFNVFAVWQPSPEEGASIPTEGKKVNNNLECSYGTVVDRALFCTPSLVTALADTAPCGAVGKTNVVAIVLVNSQKYGGAASYRPTVRVGSFSVSHFNLQDSSDKGLFASLFFHEVGHCYADLMDEYDTRQTESGTITYPNCASSQAVGGTQWASWANFDTFNANQQSVKKLPTKTLSASDRSFFEIAPTAVPICGWSNYYKPSSACFMEKLKSGGSVPRLCPICREQTVKSMYKTGMNILFPVCPLPTETLYIDPASAGVYIFINSKIAGWTHAGDGGVVEVQWSCGGRVLSASEPGYMLLTPAEYTSCHGTLGGEITVTVTMTDWTVWVSEAGREKNMAQTASWNVRMVANLAAFKATITDNPTPCMGTTARLPSEVQPPVLKTKAGIDFSYVSVCGDSNGCTTTYSTRQYNATNAQRASAEDDVESLVFGLPGIMCLVGVLLFLFSWLMMAKKLSYSRVKSVFSTKYDTMVGIVRRTIVFSGLFFIIVAIVATAWGMSQYNDVGAFLKLMLIAGFVLCICLFVMAFVGTTAAFYRAKNLLYLNSFGLLCTFAIMIYVTHVVIYVGAHITDSGCATSSEVTAGTDGLVSAPCSYEDNDVAICGIEGVGCELKELWKSLVKHYPEKICAFQEELKCSGYKQPCNKQVSEDYCPKTCDDTNLAYGDACKVKLQDDIKKECERFTPLIVVLTILMGLAMVNNLVLACLLGSQRKEQKETQLTALQSYTKQARQGKPVAMPGTQNQALRLMRALDDEQRVLMTKRFNQADKDGNGKLDIRELALFLRAALSPEITAAEVKEAFALADTDSDGAISFSEFRELFTTAGGTEMTPVTGQQLSKAPSTPPPVSIYQTTGPPTPQPKYLDTTVNTYGSRTRASSNASSSNPLNTSLMTAQRI